MYSRSNEFGIFVLSLSLSLTPILFGKYLDYSNEPRSLEDPSPARFKKGSCSAISNIFSFSSSFSFIATIFVVSLRRDPACHVASIKDLRRRTLESRYWNRKRDLKCRRGRHEEARWLEISVAMFVNILIFDFVSYDWWSVFIFRGFEGKRFVERINKRDKQYGRWIHSYL